MSPPKSEQLMPSRGGPAPTTAAILVLAAGGFCLAAAPQPQPEMRVGATRASAVAEATPGGTFPQGSGVKMIGASADGDRPCHEQTWPYIELHCLKPVTDEGQALALSQPFGIRDLLIGMRERAVEHAHAASLAADTPPPASAVVRTVKPENVEITASVAAGEGLAVRSETPRAVEEVPLPQPRPQIAESDSVFATAEHDQFFTEAEDDAFDAPPAMTPLSPAEQRRMAREWRRMERAERYAAGYRAHESRWGYYSGYRREDVLHR